MKILLIQPPNTHIIPIVEPRIVIKEVGIYPPLGLMYIASYLEQNVDCEVRIVDMVAEGMDILGLRRVVEEFKPQVVGIQAITQVLLDVVEVAKTLKEIDKDIHVCVGGPHAYIFPRETAALPTVDSVIPGEGEFIFAELIEYVRKGKDLRTINGIVYKDNGNLVVNEGKKWIEDLDSLPPPARHLVPKDKYYCIIETNSPMTTMVTTRGCPYNCTFCLGFERGRYRERSVAKVVDEIEDCINSGYRDILFWDSIFTVKKDRVMKICQEILDRGLKISWSIRARINHIDHEMLGKLREAGCKRIQYGIEAGTDKTLARMGKGITADKIRQDIQMASEFGFTVYGDFMIGFPGETRDDILETIRFARDLKLDYANFALTTPYPDTQLYKWGFEKNLYKKDYWKEFATNPREGFVPEVWEENLSRQELIDLLAYAYQTFYLRPGYILRRLLEIRSYEDFLRKARTGLRMLNKKMLEI